MFAVGFGGAILLRRLLAGRFGRSRDLPLAKGASRSDRQGGRSGKKRKKKSRS
jgi:hypothetical protein